MKLYLKELREMNCLSKKEFAELFNVSYKTYNSYETGKTSPPIEFLCSVSEHFSVMLDWLVNASSNKGAYQQYLLNSDEAETIELYKKLSPRKREYWKTIALLALEM